MKTFFVLLFPLLIALHACQNDPKPANDSSTRTELERLRAELQAKREELQDKQQIAELEKEMAELDRQLNEVSQPASRRGTDATKTGTTAASRTSGSTGPKGRINTGNVVMRSSSSVQSNKISNFNANEEVTILETQNVSNEGEAIVTQDVKFYNSQSSTGEVALTLPKGKAVVIESFDSDNNQYHVTYQDVKKGRLYATIDADRVETISYSTWYRVRRANGQEGWVLGKFVNQ